MFGKGPKCISVFDSIRAMHLYSSRWCCLLHNDDEVNTNVLANKFSVLNEPCLLFAGVSCGWWMIFCSLRLI